MVEYCAVPKAKQGELRAFNLTLPEALKTTHVVWDIQPKVPLKQLREVGDSIANDSHGCKSVAVDLAEVGGFTAARWEELNCEINSSMFEAETPLTPVLGSDAQLSAYLRSSKMKDYPAPILRMRRPKKRLMVGELARMADALQSRDAQAGLMLDLRAVNEENEDFLEDLAFDFCEAAQDYPWLSLTVVVGSFPQSLAWIASDTREELARRDWKLLSRIAVSFSDRNLPLRIGDYMIAHPDFASGGRGTPSIRYTADGHWVVYMGDRDRKEDLKQFCGLARLMVRDEAYRDPSFSWGDFNIQDIAQNESRGPGSMTTWRSIGTSHHLIFASQDVASLGEKLGKGGSPPEAEEA